VTRWRDEGSREFFTTASASPGACTTRSSMTPSATTPTPCRWTPHAGHHDVVTRWCARRRGGLLRGRPNTTLLMLDDEHQLAGTWIASGRRRHRSSACHCRDGRAIVAAGGLRRGARRWPGRWLRLAAAGLTGGAGASTPTTSSAPPDVATPASTAISEPPPRFPCRPRSPSSISRAARASSSRGRTCSRGRRTPFHREGVHVDRRDEGGRGGRVDADQLPWPGGGGRADAGVRASRFGRPLSAREALAHSCNSFFVAVAKRTTWPRIAAELRAAGLRHHPRRVSPRSVRSGSKGPSGARTVLAAFARVVDRARRQDAVADRVLLGGCGTRRARGRRARSPTRAGCPGQDGQRPHLRWRGGGAGGGRVSADAPRYGVVVIGAGSRPRRRVVWRCRLASRAVPGMAAAPGGAPSGDHQDRHARGEGVRVSDVPLEDYVAGVVSAEAPPDAPPALREALAIAARSYARRTATPWPRRVRAV